MFARMAFGQKLGLIEFLIPRLEILGLTQSRDIA